MIYDYDFEGLVESHHYKEMNGQHNGMAQCSFGVCLLIKLIKVLNRIGNSSKIEKIIEIHSIYIYPH